MNLEVRMRQVASNIINLKDGFRGIQRHKEDFHRLLSKSDAERDIQLREKLQLLMSHAYRTTSYYREVLDDIGAKPQDITRTSELAVLPFLGREVLQASGNQLISTNYKPEQLIRSSTGGTTGTPVTFYIDRECVAIRRGRQQAILELCGYYAGDRCGALWGVDSDLVGKSARINLRRQFRQFASGTETLCCKVLTHNEMENFYQRLRRFKPRVLYGYPNALSHFAAFVETNALPALRVDTIICTAERLTQKQRTTLTNVFGGEVFNVYATREHGFIAFECRNHNGFHVDIGNVVLEIVENGKVADIGQPGDIVLTDLHNLGMPFIRNRIGDRGRLCREPCDCGNPLPLLKSLDGRITDTIYRPDGSRVDGCVLADLFTDIKPIRLVQIVQNRLEEIDVNVVVSDGYCKADEAQLLNRIREFMGPQPGISLHVVPDIPRNANSGKYQEFVCRISPPS
jgi:phenylacetate-CoA ligase